MKISGNYQKKCGIYCLGNTTNGHKYVGSSNNIYDRLMFHRHDLRRGIHQNCKLQNGWNKHGEENFECYALEYCDRIDLYKIEQKYIDLFGYYNITKEVATPRMTEETKKKHSITKKRMFAEGSLKSLSSVKLQQYDIFGNLIKTWDNIRDCERFFKLGSTTIYYYFAKKHTIYSHILKGFVFIREGNNIDSVDFKELTVHSIKDLQTDTVYIGSNYKLIQNYLGIYYQLTSYPKYPYKKRYLAALIKPCELLENLEGDNQQPSIVVIH